MGLSNWEITLRLVLAALYGGLIGMERHQNGKPVGRRTHAIICVSGAMIAIIGLCGFENLDYFTRDPTRLPVGVLTGLGFVGAGVIWQDKGGVKGLTTAATVYATACIGLTVGFGYYYLSTLGTILIFLILCSGHIIGKIDKHKKIENLENNMRANSKDEMKRQAYYDQIKSEQNIKNQDTDEEEYKKNINEETNNIQKQPEESTNNNLNNT